MKRLSVLKHLDKASDLLQDDLEESKSKKDMQYFQTILSCLKLMQGLKIALRGEPHDKQRNTSAAGTDPVSEAYPSDLQGAN